ncbi:Rieske 2Fe-2S domain-containing protein [soil metagenome]
MDEQKFPINNSLEAKQLNMGRRRLLETGVWATTSLVGLTLLSAGGCFIVGDALKDKHAEWVDVGKIANLPAGQMHQTTYSSRRKDAWRTIEERGLLYVFSEDGAIYTVLSAVCTHLGCNVHWEAENDGFRCPCHDAVFSRTGEVMTGPPRHALSRLEAKLEDGTLLVLV